MSYWIMVIISTIFKELETSLSLEITGETLKITEFKFIL